MKHFTAIVHQGEPEEGGFWATCLEVPGANGQSETRDECLRNLKEAIQLLLETERKRLSGWIPRQRRRNWCWHETPGLARSPARTRLRGGSGRRQPLHLAQSADRAQEAISRHNEIKKLLARSICRNLSLPIPPAISTTDAQIRAMRELRRAPDSNGILNPGKNVWLRASHLATQSK